MGEESEQLIPRLLTVGLILMVNLTEILSGVWNLKLETMSIIVRDPT